MNKCYDLSADAKYASDLATVLERLLSQLSLGAMNDSVRDAHTQANNVLDEYQQALDAEDAAIKKEFN